MPMTYLQKLSEVERIIIHASATPSDMDIGREEIDRWHRAKGWWAIGYHFVIRRDGTVEKGRSCSRFGAHASGYNRNSIGICMIGGVKRVPDRDGRNDPDGPRWDLIPEDNYTDEQWKSLMYLTRQLVNQCGENNVAVIGHRDLPKVAKACPCFDVGSWWDSARILQLPESEINRFDLS